MRTVNLKRVEQVRQREACIVVKEITKEFKTFIKTIFPKDPDDDFSNLENIDYITSMSGETGRLWDTTDLEEIEEEGLIIYSFDEMFEEEFEFGEKVLISNGDQKYERVFIGKKDDKVYFIHGCDDINFEKDGYFRVNCWKNVTIKKIPKKVKLTKSEIADKFGISEEQLEII